MINLIKVELYKLKTSKTFLAVIFLSVLQSILCPIIFSQTMTGKQVLITVFETQDVIGFFMLVGLFTAFYIADEFSSKYIKNLIVYGHRRRDILMAKIIVYYIGITIISLISPILITIINTFINGYGEAITLNTLMFIIRVFMLMLLVYIGLSSIAVLIAVICKNSTLVIISLIVLDSINRFGLAFAIRNSIVDLIYSNIIFGQKVNAVAEKLSILQGTKVIVISLITIAVSIFLSIYFFEKADIR
ncbi:ABC-2 type transport system permease protein [Clostridium cavendishii DSM 21758]|uniref:ABC-2 type transport system permease protein n=1 Tax=Clostridium cavendishii DSM 21758 TaxID=1121302 RepID=A0A1M6DDJ4_9CLOT|nr:ABC transporter permease [Clostridium cavendishii]SHI71282.1 ABC-2 type transport system permease protein [Clostridium cavendishii DSM 21758]